MDLNLHVDPYSIIWHKKSSPLYSHPPRTNHWDSLQDEIQHLQQTFQNKEYISWDSQYALHNRKKPRTTSEKPMGVALLSYQNFTSK